MELHLPVNEQDIILEVHAIPCQSQNLPLPHTSKQGNKEQGFKAIPFDSCEKSGNVGFIERPYFRFLHFGELAKITIRQRCFALFTTP